MTEEQLGEYLDGAVGTVPEEKHNAHKFLHSVATTKDTTRTGYLREEEVGIPKLSARTLKELALFGESIADEPEWSSYFKERSEILTSTSLSKNAKLIDLAVINRREVADVTKKPVVRKNLFGKSKVVSEV